MIWFGPHRGRSDRSHPLQVGQASFILLNCWSGVLDLIEHSQNLRKCLAAVTQTLSRTYLWPSKRRGGVLVPSLPHMMNGTALKLSSDLDRRGVVAHLQSGSIRPYRSAEEFWYG